MKQKRFNEGEEVICVDADWKWSDTEEKADGPEFHQIVKIKEYSHYDRGWFVIIEGYEGEEDSFEEKAFDPLPSDEQLYSDLNEEPVETSDLQ